MGPNERLFVHEAFRFLDHPGFLIRLANAIGRPLAVALETLPAKHQKIIHRASRTALNKGLVVVTRKMNQEYRPKNFSLSEHKSRNLGHWHSLASFGLGAAGGLFGIMSLPVELPATTAIILRSIASIAHEFGMDLRDPQVQLECLYILSLGTKYQPNDGDAMYSAYWTSRTAFAQLSGEAATFLANKSARDLAKALDTRVAPVLVKLIASVASRFEVVVGEKLLAEALPIVGAIGGGLINATFTEYFSEAARYHFGLRALERDFGRRAVEKCYLDSLGKRAMA